MRETGYAKLNLALHVRAKESDGYHRIETLFAFCEAGDTLVVREGDGLSLEVMGPYAADLRSAEDNLVLRAARALQEVAAPSRGAALFLEKRLPVASGIGGGSADAAATLRLLKRWWNLDLDLLPLARELGADVPACVRSDTTRGEGRGDLLDYSGVPEVRGTPVLLVNPGVAVATPAVFAAWDGIDRGGLADVPLQAARNDLQDAALAVAPEIADVLASLAATKPELTRMSGSGATCFALYGDQLARDDAEERIASKHPGWWRLSTRLR